jgi:hypothetical protein
MIDWCVFEGKLALSPLLTSHFSLLRRISSKNRGGAPLLQGNASTKQRINEPMFAVDFCEGKPSLSSLLTFPKSAFE